MTKLFISIQRIASAASLAIFSLSIHAAESTYQVPAEYVAEIFPLKPQTRILWLSREAQAEVTRILGHAPSQLRQRYWSDGGKTLWILDEIGKEDMITAGFVVREGRVEQTKVLIFRESRGMEVRNPAFTSQFKGASLSSGNFLDRNIDAISGATLSVGAMVRMARAALYFERLTQQK